MGYSKNIYYLKFYYLKIRKRKIWKFNMIWFMKNDFQIPGCFYFRIIV